MPRSVFASMEKSVAESVFHVLKEDVVSPDAFPPYTRSTVDGYALQAEDVYCASASLPAFLRVKGRVMMGETPSEGRAEGNVGERARTMSALSRDPARSLRSSSRPLREAVQ